MGSDSEAPRGGPVEGQTLAGKYLVRRKVGVGGMCIVYEAEHIHLRQAVALKMLRPELAKDPESVARFEQEARAAAQLRSTNVARVYDVDWLPEKLPYITMELLVGQDLGRVLSRAARLSPQIAVDYVRQAAAGIAEAHALGIIHRDLKPENLFLSDLGELTDRKLLKILDFGIAKDISDTARRLTAPDAVFGTVDYMSPEQIRSSSKVDHRADLWSLGIILFELVTGRTPFTGDARAVIAQIVSDPIPSPATLVPSLPDGLVFVIMKMLDKDPEMRFQSAEELRHALAPHSSLEPIDAVLARLPPQLVPRRGTRTEAPTLDGDGRDARTNVSWEATDKRGRRRGWVMVPLLLAVGIGVGAAVLERRHALPFGLDWKAGFAMPKGLGFEGEPSANVPQTESVSAPTLVSTPAVQLPTDDAAPPSAASVNVPEAPHGPPPSTTAQLSPKPAERRAPRSTPPSSAAPTTPAPGPRLPKYL